MCVYRSADISLRLRAVHGELNHGMNADMTTSALQHVLGPFGTVKTYLPLAKNITFFFNCYYSTEIYRPQKDSQKKMHVSPWN